MVFSQIVPANTRRALNATDPRWKLKTSLHMLTLIACIVSISLFAHAIPLWNANFFHNRGPNRGDWTDGISLGPLTFTFVATLLALFYTIIKKHPCPPKTTVTITILIMLSLAPALVLAGHGSLFKHWRPPAVRSQNGILRCNLINIFTRDCEPILYKVGELQIGAIAFGAMTWVLVFITFLVSLYEHRAAQVGEARRKHHRGLRRLILLVAGQKRHHGVEKGGSWHGNERARAHSSRSKSEASTEAGHRSERSRRQGREKRSEHRQSGTRRHYHSSRKVGSGDTVPFMLVSEPEMVVAHPGNKWIQ